MWGSYIADAESRGLLRCGDQSISKTIFPHVTRELASTKDKRDSSAHPALARSWRQVRNGASAWSLNCSNLTQQPNYIARRKLHNTETRNLHRRYLKAGTQPQELHYSQMRKLYRENFPL